jgi:hypothetical protein
MKYVITESKLDKVIFKYLDMKLENTEKTKGKYFDIIFAFPNEDYGLLGWEKLGILYVYYTLSKEIQTLFGLEQSDTLEAIGRYVKDRYNLEVKKVSNHGRLYLNKLLIDTI